MAKKYVIIGASVAGLAAVDILRKQDREGQIILISKETDIYSKCIMHFYMTGQRTKEELSFVKENFLEENRVCWVKGKETRRIDTERKQVILEDGERIEYDKVLVATGSHAFVPPVEGITDTGNVLAFHSLKNCDEMMEISENVRNIVILGAGLVGVDVAYGLSGRYKDKNITLIDMKGHMMSIQLDERAASVYEKEFAARGVRQIYHTGIEKVEKNTAGNIQSVLLTNGKTIPCDLLILAVGTRANTELALASGLQTDQYGLVIDDTCRTSCEDIYGAGDVTGRDMVWPAASKEAMTAAYNMTGTEEHMTDFFKGKSTINMFDIPAMAYGMPEAPDDSYTVECREGEDGSYQKLIHKNGEICGVILQKNLEYAGVLNQLISSRPDLTKLEKPLLDIDYGDLLWLTGECVCEI